MPLQPHDIERGVHGRGYCDARLDRPPLSRAGRAGLIRFTRQPTTGGRAMLNSGRVVFGEMEMVVFGKPASEAIDEEARRLDAERVFLMVSGTLNRTTDEIAKVRQALGNRFAGLFDHMPPHTPRHA